MMITIDFASAPYAMFPKLYLESVLFNLISNAIKYSSPERKSEIKLNSYIHDNWLHVEIRDNGLGLFMTKNQIEAMGGSITVQSTVAEGTTFTLRLNKYSDEES